jgi:hypothetical protein
MGNRAVIAFDENIEKKTNVQQYTYIGTVVVVP